MKIKNLLLLFFVSISMISCSSDDDAANNQTGNTSGNIVGAWAITSLNYSGTTVTTAGGTTVTTDFIGVGSDFNGVIEFIGATNVYNGIGTYDVELTTTIAGQTTVQNHDDVDVASNGNWSKNGNILTITANGDADDFEILVLNATTLKLKLIHSESDSQQGYSVATDLTTITEYVRL